MMFVLAQATKACGGSRGRAPLILNLGTGWKFNPLNAELNPICHLLGLLGAHPILHVSRIRVNSTEKWREMYDDDDGDDDDTISTGKCTAKSVHMSLLRSQMHVGGVEVELH